MKKLSLIVVVTIVAAFAWYLASPHDAMSQLRIATLESDVEELRERVDFPSVREQFKADLTPIMAEEFVGDQICKAARFEAYRAALGPHFKDKQLPNSAANSDISPFFAAHVDYPHSVLTQHLIDGEGEPTIGARDEILDALDRRLRDPA